MIELLILADDFTGALDTGVRFAARGEETLVVTDVECDFASIDSGVHVLVIATGTRHVSPAEAYATVQAIVRRAREAGIPYLYKKTDSALRGNVGAELTALMDSAGCDRLLFAPAFPRLRRFTRNGIQYIDNVPVGESVFARDPFEPVKTSYIPDILRAQSDRPVILHKKEDHILPDAPGIHVFDAETDGDLRAVALNRGHLRFTAGCAGFAAVLADTLGMPSPHTAGTEDFDSLTVICGSVNPVTVRQLDAAEKAGYPRIRLTAAQLLDSGWMDTGAGEALLRRWVKTAGSSRLCMLDVNGVDERELLSLAAKMGLAGDAVRERIALTLGQLARRLLDLGLEKRLMCTGGDTLLAVMNALRVTAFTPIGELAPGVVLTGFPYNGKSYQVIAKSGGFGEADLLCRLCAPKKQGGSNYVDKVRAEASPRGI